MPTYPSGYTTAPIPAGAPPPQHQAAAPAAALPHSGSSEEMMDLPNPTNLPGSSEDYAKALQEAYRKGAEAAARMAQQQPIPTAASCPNFQTGPHVAPPPAMDPASAGAYQQQQVHPPPPTQPAIPDPLSSSMPPPAPGAPATATSYAPAPVPQQQQTVTYTYPPQTSQPPPPVQQHQAHAPPPPQQHMPPPTHPAGAPAPNVVTSGVPTHVKPPPGRSLSMPDMSAYAAKAEEEKRQKRLARNRASARLRRLRKKNLVRDDGFY